MKQQSELQSARLKVEAVQLICWLISSARGLLDEPKLYGPRRLVDATQQVMELLQATGIDDPSWHRLQEQILDGRSVMQRDAEYARQFLDSLMDTATQLLIET